ncbi:DNA-3-methyladenine glycosylase, partial [Singulisphaera rosea]
LEGKTNGPGLLCRALGIDRGLNGKDLVGEELFVASPDRPEPFEIVARPRVGVDYAGDWAACELRFYVRGNAYVSRK